MQKKGIIAILSTVVLMLVASISLVFALGPCVSASHIEGRALVFDDWDDFVIDENGMLTNLSSTARSELLNYGHIDDMSYGWTTGEKFSFNENSWIREIKLVIPEGVKIINWGPYYRYGGQVAWAPCVIANNITSVVLPNSLEIIGDYAFSKCEALNKIIIPDTVTSIGKNAFSDSRLTGLDIPASVTKIGNAAFHGCYGLKNINLGRGITNIGEDAFYRCGFEDIVIPINVTTIGEDAFADCGSLNTIKCECSEEYANENWDALWKRFCSNAEVIWNYMPTYNVAFNVNGGSVVTSQTVSKNEYATVPVSNPTREGYDFVRWYTDDENVAFDFANTPITADMTINALWQIKTYTITFDSNGGSVVDEQRKEYGSYLARPDDPTLENCIFMGWYLNNGLYNFNNSVKADMTLQAKWGHTVTFDANGGSSVDSQVVIDGECAYSRLTYREHYNFVGWYFNGAEYNFTTPVTANVTLTAQWEIEHCWVYFDSNGGSVVNAQNVTYGEIPTEPTEPTREDYFFVGWYKIISNGAGNGNYDVAEYEFDTPITEETTLTAVWKKKCRIIFNGGSEELMVTRIVGEGDLLEEPNLSREGYTLESWATDPNGMVTYDFTEPVAGDLTLYAQWAENSTEPEVTNPETPSEQENTEIKENKNNNKALALGIAGGSVAGLGAISAIAATIIAKKRRK